MRAAMTSIGFVAIVLLAGCAAPSVKEPLVSAPEAPPAAVAPAAAAAQPAAAKQPVATQAAVVESQANADDNEVVCRNEKILGTRISKRVCKSREQLRLEEAAAREMMKRRDQKSHGVTDAITGGG